MKNGLVATPKNTNVQKLKPPNSDELVVAFDALNAAWNEAEADFAAMRVPVTVSHQVLTTEMGDPENPKGETTMCLEWTRHQNQWRICWVRRDQLFHEDFWQEEAKPIAECPMEVRVDMAGHLGRLRRKMKEARNNYLPEVVAAVAAIKEALAD